MSNTIQAVIIDKREPDWVKSLDFSAPTISDILDAGDLQIATSDSVRLVIERKTPSDFLNSIADNRLLNQTARMRELSPWCYIIVTGSLPFDPETRVGRQGGVSQSPGYQQPGDAEHESG